MLILTRRVGETLIITTPDGIKIELVVLGVKGNQVRIGTEAPSNVTVDRKEIYERKQAGVPAPVKANHAAIN